MDCPNCGVYNPEERDICWRCDQELPTPEKKEKRRGAPWTGRRMWLVIAVILIVWIVLTWLVPLLLGGGLMPTP